MQAQSPPHNHEPVGLLWIGDATEAVVHFTRRAPHVRVAQGDAASLVATLQSGTTDLLVLDATLDGIDVSAVLGHLQAAQLDTPVLLLAHPGGEDLAIQAGRFVVCDCVVKTADYLLQLLPAIGQLRARHDLVALFRTNRQSQDRLRTILEFQPAVICVIGADGIITAMNRAGLTLLGAAREQVVGRPFASLLPDEAGYDAIAFIRRVCQGEAADFEHVVLRDGRQPLVVRTRAVPFRNGDTVVALATVQERPQHAQQQRETEQTAADLARATAALQHVHAELAQAQAALAPLQDAHEAFETLRADFNPLRAELDNLRAERGQWLGEHAKWTAEREQWLAERHQLEARLGEAEPSQSVRKQLEDERDALTHLLHTAASRSELLEAERSALAQTLESLQRQLFEATTALSSERSAWAQERDNAAWQHQQDRDSAAWQHQQALESARGALEQARHEVASRSQELADMQQASEADHAAMLKLRDDLLRFMADADSQCRAIIEQHEARLAPGAGVRNQSFT